MRLLNRRGQSAIEQAVVLAGFIAVLMVAIHYFKNAVDGGMKSSSDRIGDQWNTANSNYNMNVTNTGTRHETLDEKGVFTSAITGSEEQKQDTASYTVNNDLTRKVTEQK